MTIRNGLLLLGLAALLSHCAEAPTAATAPPAEAVISDTASWLIEQAIAAQGIDRLGERTVSFRFRELDYSAAFAEGRFTYTRTQIEAGDTLVDTLTNAGLVRYRNGTREPLTPKDSAAYANSVNSVIYFALLPRFLRDPAVVSDYLGQTRIGDQAYHKLSVGFRPEGGGKDYEDEFVYWFDTSDFSLDYLAYNYLTDGGGARFRSAYNVRYVDSIRFADYLNWKPQNDRRDVQRFDSLYQAGLLDTLSRIETEGVVLRE
jgi:hypothetical protein